MTGNQATIDSSINGESGCSFLNNTRFPFIDLTTEPVDYLACLEHYGNSNCFESNQVFASNSLPSSFSLCSDTSILEPLALDMFDISSGSNHTSVSAEISPANFSTNTALTASIGNDFLHSSSSSSLLGTFANSLDSFSPALTSFENHHASKESNLMLLYPTTGEVPPSSNVHVFPQFLSKDNSITHPSSSNPLHVSNQVGYFNYDPTSASPIATSPHSLTIPYPIAPVYSSNSLTSPLSTSNIHTVSTSENYTKYCHELKESSPLPDFGIPTPSNLDCSCPNDESTHPRLKSRGLNLISKRSDSNPWSILQQGFNFCEESNETSPHNAVSASESFPSLHNQQTYSELNLQSPSLDTLHNSAGEKKLFFYQDPLSPSDSMKSNQPPKPKTISRLPMSLDSTTLSSSQSPSATSFTALSTPSTPTTPSTPSTHKTGQPISNPLFCQDFNWLAKSLVNHITDLVLVLASNGIIAWVSPTSIQSVGFEPEEMYGHPLGEFLHPNYHPCAPKQLTHAVYANNYFESNIRFRRKDGSYTVLHVIGRVFQPTFYDSANESLSKPVSMSTSSMVDPLFSHSSIPSSKLLSPTSKASSASNPVDSQNYVLITCRQYPASKFSSMLDEMIDLQFENKYLKNKLNSTYSLVEQEISELSALHQSHLYTGDRTCIPTEAIHASPSSFSSPESFSSDLYSAMSNSKLNSNFAPRTETDAFNYKKSVDNGTLRKNSKTTLSNQIPLRTKYHSEQEKQASFSKKRKKATNKRDWLQERICYDCGVTQSPEWRRGPTGANTLCNACGLRFAKRQRLSVTDPSRSDSQTQSIPT